MVAKKDGSFVPRQKRARDEPASSSSKVQVVGSGTGTGKEDPTSEGKPAAVKLVVNHVPHRILFAQNLPEECSDQQLATLFQQYAGFQEVRMVPGKQGIAFVEFQDLVQAGIALQQLHGFQLTATHLLNLTYGNQ